MADEFLTRSELSLLLKTPIATLARWAYIGTGPRYFKVGRRVLYRRSDVEAFIARRLVGEK